MGNRRRTGTVVVIALILTVAVAIHLLRSPREASSEPVKKTKTVEEAVPGNKAGQQQSLEKPGDQKTVEPCTLEEAGKVRPLALYVVSRKEKEGSVAHHRADQRPKRARLDEKVYLYAVLKAKYARAVVYYTSADRVSMGRASLPGRRVRPWPLACQPTIRWYKVEPTHNSYSYVKRSNPIAYAETSFARGWRILADVHPTHLGDQFTDVRSGVGVMRYKATLRLGEWEVATPGKDALSNGGISRRVHRVTHRPRACKISDYALELFNTPYIWGSMGYQVNGQVGVDCADLMVYALRRSGRKIGYTWSKGLVANRRLFARVTSGRVRVGDILYHGRHVGMLHEENGNGKLDAGDKVVHTLFHEPEVVSVRVFGWPEVILRWRGKTPMRSGAVCP